MAPNTIPYPISKSIDQSIQVDSDWADIVLRDALVIKTSIIRVSIVAFYGIDTRTMQNGWVSLPKLPIRFISKENPLKSILAKNRLHIMKNTHLNIARYR